MKKRKNEDGHYLRLAVALTGRRLWERLRELVRMTRLM